MTTTKKLDRVPLWFVSAIVIAVSLFAGVSFHPDSRQGCTNASVAAPGKNDMVSIAASPGNQKAILEQLEQARFASLWQTEQNSSNDPQK